ncbi:MAG TPA: lipoate--protein ligase family protein [Verrucomicrobiae bacterium]|jgi:lipoate-protein ligase A|nr:lipoate--protein ligase family protein [Verrucomicrobiae bacterium]
MLPAALTNQILRKICCWDATLPTPAANLAADEALLNACEAGGPEALRFWEPPAPFVVLGFSNHAAREANVENCRRDHIPILRRVSGGGAVLQGPGCLNYSLILRLDRHESFQTIPSSNSHIMARQRDAVAAVLGRPVAIEGTSDLCLGALKFSGNSQRRHRGALIFHGTFLLRFDLPAIARYLAMPSRQPHYRQERSHADFLTNVPAPASQLKSALRAAWEADEDLTDLPDYEKLVAEKYSRDEWNLKY